MGTKEYYGEIEKEWNLFIHFYFISHTSKQQNNIIFFKGVNCKHNRLTCHFERKVEKIAKG